VTASLQQVERKEFELETRIEVVPLELVGTEWEAFVAEHHSVVAVVDDVPNVAALDDRLAWACRVYHSDHLAGQEEASPFVVVVAADGEKGEHADETGAVEERASSAMVPDPANPAIVLLAVVGSGDTVVEEVLPDEQNDGSPEEEFVEEHGAHDEEAAAHI